MPVPWTNQERYQKRKELYKLYVNQNRSIREVGEILGIKYQTVFDRLGRLRIKTCPEKKLNFLNKRKDIILPATHSEALAEFVGILLGDGHISKTQVIVTVNKNEADYIKFLKGFMKTLFGAAPHTCSSLENRHRKNAVDVYLGSVDLVRYFLNMGLVTNKVKMQVDAPAWLGTKSSYSKCFLRGFFDTDGSVYKLKFGAQISYKNASLPLLRSARRMLCGLQYHPSQITGRSLYLTRRDDLKRFFREIRPHNQKHIERASRLGVV